MKKILITGGNGFVGRSLTNLLNSNSEYLIESVDLDTYNLCEWPTVLKIPKFDIIVHLAGRSYVPDYFKDPLGFYNNNIQSMLNILEKAKIDKSRVIFFSTYVYGIPQYLPIDENHVKNPLNPYTQSKLVCEELCQAYHRDFGVPVTIFRPFNIYGPGQNLSFFIPTIINQIKNKIIKLNDSRPKRDFIYIKDVIDAVYLSIINNDSSYSIYNLGSGVSTSIKEIVSQIISISGSKSIVEFSEEIRQGEIMDTVADITKIKNELGWKPKISIEKGIEWCIENIHNY